MKTQLKIIFGVLIGTVVGNLIGWYVIGPILYGLF
jgi:hypothetical protein